MSFNIVIKNIADKELGPILARLHLPRGASYETTHQANGLDLAPKKKTYSTRPRKDSIMTMTGKTAQKDSKIEMAMELFEKFEKRKGIGTVTVQDFRDHLVKKEQDIHLQQRCVTEKFLSYV